MYNMSDVDGEGTASPLKMSPGDRGWKKATIDGSPSARSTAAGSSSCSISSNGSGASSPCSGVGAGSLGSPAGNSTREPGSPPVNEATSTDADELCSEGDGGGRGRGWEARSLEVSPLPRDASKGASRTQSTTRPQGTTIIGGGFAAASAADAVSRNGEPLGPRSSPCSPPQAACRRCCRLCLGPEAEEERDKKTRCEDEEWLNRQRLAGACARLVRYEAADAPWEDILLAGGGGRSVRVAGVQQQGQAQAAGVKVGDRLVSIDGRRITTTESAEALQHGLAAPCCLVFLGFVGKLNAEVRLSTKLPICGLSLRYQLFGAGTQDRSKSSKTQAPSVVNVRIEDQVEFYPSDGAFFVAASKPPSGLPEQEEGNVLSVADERDGSLRQAVRSSTPSEGIFEVKAAEARSIVSFALRIREAEKAAAAAAAAAALKVALDRAPLGGSGGKAEALSKPELGPCVSMSRPAQRP